jgi:hypothetical protein
MSFVCVYVCVCLRVKDCLIIRESFNFVLGTFCLQNMQYSNTKNNELSLNTHKCLTSLAWNSQTPTSDTVTPLPRHQVHNEPMAGMYTVLCHVQKSDDLITASLPYNTRRELYNHDRKFCFERKQHMLVTNALCTAFLVMKMSL